LYEKGFSAHYNLSPVVYYNDWLKDYKELFNIINGEISEDFKKQCEAIKMPNVNNLSERIYYTTKVKGIRFDAILNVKKLSTAEFIEVSAFTKDEKSVINNLHKILAVFYKPSSKWFGLKKVTMPRSEVAELFLHNMDIKIAYPLAVFFLKSWNNFTPLMHTYLEKKMKQVIAMTKEQSQRHSSKTKKTSQANGGGMKRSLI
jgi:hypothetical protein